MSEVDEKLLKLFYKIKDNKFYNKLIDFKKLNISNVDLLESVLVGNVVPEFLSSVRIQEKVSSIIIVQERKAAFCAGTGMSKFHMRI